MKQMINPRGLVCLLDMDGVIADFTGGYFSTILKEPLPQTILWDHVKPQDWKKMGEEFWANLKPTLEMFDIISTVEETFGQENTCLLSSPCLTYGCLEGKMAWIRRYLPKYSRQFLFGPRKRFCAHARAVLIDDYDKNIDGFVSAGGQGVLIPRSWNRDAARPMSEALADIQRYGMPGEA